MNLVKWNRVLICILIVFNIYGLLIQNMTGINRQLFVGSVLMLLVSGLGIKCLWQKKIKIQPIYLGIIGFEIFISLIHLTLFQNIENEFSMFLCFCTFFLIGIISTKKNYEAVLKTIVLISVAMCIEAIYYYIYVVSRGWRVFNVRIFTSAPKEDYTFILTISFVIAFCEILFHSSDNRKKILMGVVILLDIFVNVIVMQSKTMFLVIAVVIATTFFVCGSKIKRIIIFASIFVFLVLVVLFLFKSDVVPDYIYVFINQATGLMEEKVQSIRDSKIYSTTFDQRYTIYLFALNLFMQHIFFGIGFFQFAEYSSRSTDRFVYVVTQTESGIVGAFLEGGLFFGMIYLCLMVIPGIVGFKCYLKNKNPNGIRTMLLSCAFLVLSLNNDTTSITFWTLLSFHFAQIFELPKDNALMQKFLNPILRK